MEDAIHNCSLPAGGLQEMQLVVDREITSLLNCVRAFPNSGDNDIDQDDTPEVFTKGIRSYFALLIVTLLLHCSFIYRLPYTFIGMHICRILYLCTAGPVYRY